MAKQTDFTDESLVRAAQAGHLDAFSALYERYLPVVYRRVFFLIPSQDVEDVTQEIFIAVIKSLKGFRHEARFSTWLRTLVNRQVVNYYRGRRPQEDYLEDAIGPDPERSSIFQVADARTKVEESILVRQALECMPDHYREIIMLRFVEGLQFDQIAELKGQSLEATKSLFRRAIAMLHKQVAND